MEELIPVLSDRDVRLILYGACAGILIYLLIDSLIPKLPDAVPLTAPLLSAAEVEKHQRASRAAQRAWLDAMDSQE